MENIEYLKKTDEVIDMELIGYGHNYSNSANDCCDCQCRDCDCSAPCFC